MVYKATKATALHQRTRTHWALRPPLSAPPRVVQPAAHPCVHETSACHTSVLNPLHTHKRTQGYTGQHPYHNRTHAADVLRNLHVILTRGGLLSRMRGTSSSTSSTITVTTAASPGGTASSQPAGSTTGDASQPSHSEEDWHRELLASYLTAIVHDYEHRGVNNIFLIKSADPLAIMWVLIAELWATLPHTCVAAMVSDLGVLLDLHH